VIWNERERGRERERESERAQSSKERKGENALPPINRRDKHNIIITHPLNGSDAIVVLDVDFVFGCGLGVAWVGWEAERKKQAGRVLNQGGEAAFCKSSHLASRSGHTKGMFRA